MSNWTKVESLLHELDETKLSRRELLTRAAGLGLAASAIAPILTACGAGGAPSQAPTSAPSSKKVTMKFGYTAVSANPVAQGFEKFASLVNERSKGDVVIQTFPAGQMGSDQELVQSAQSGALQIGNSSNNNLDSFTSSMEVLELPFLINSRDAYRKFWNTSISDNIRKEFETKVGVKVLMVMDAAGFRSIETVSAKVRKLSDLQGLKLRVAPTPIEEATFKAWKANPVAMAYNQVFTALQQKTLDGEVLQPVWFDSDKHYEAAKNICDIHYIMLSHLAVINLPFYQGLPNDIKQLVDTAAKDAEDYEWQIAGEESDKGIAALKAMPDIDWFTPSSSELGEWQRSSRPVWDQFSADIGADLIKKVEALN